MLWRAVFLDGKRQHQVRIEDAGNRHPHARDPHHDPCISHRRQPEATIFRTDRCTEQPKFPHLLHDFRGPSVRMIVLFYDRPNFFFEPAVYGVEQQRLVGQIEITDRR